MNRSRNILIRVIVACSAIAISSARAAPKGMMGGTFRKTLGQTIVLAGNDGSLPLPNPVGTSTHIDPIAQPPNAANIAGIDGGGAPMLLRDRNPSGSGDIFGLFRAGAAFYLVLSINQGASWSYLTATSGSPPTQNDVRGSAIEQDSVGYKVHWFTWPYASNNGYYHRAALSYTSGHISGWAWESVDRPGPSWSFDPTGEWQGRSLALHEVIDGNGVHVLIINGSDDPSDTAERKRLLVARTVPGARALDPLTGTDWVRLDGGVGSTVLGAWWAAAGSDSAALINFNNQVGITGTAHTAANSFGQVMIDRSLHFFTGDHFYNNTNIVGVIHRWRFTASGANWIPADIGISTVAQSSSSKTSLGNASTTINYAWLVYGNDSGLHIGRVDTAGSWVADAIAQPDSMSGVYWDASATVSETGPAAWTIFEKHMPGTNSYADFTGYYNGSWAKTDVTAQFSANPGWTAAGLQGAATWWTIGNVADRVGVWAYGYYDWGGPTQHYSIHVFGTSP